MRSRYTISAAANLYNVLRKIKYIKKKLFNNVQNSSCSVVYVVSQRFTERFKRKEMISCFTPSPLLTFLPVETSPKHFTAPHRAAGRLGTLGLTAHAGSRSGRRVEEKRKSTAMITVTAANTQSSSPVHQLISEALNALSTQ